MRRVIMVLAAGAIAVGVLVTGAAAATTTIVVTPSAMSGWQVVPDGTVPYSFATGPAAIGSGSLQFGPIDGTAGANKFIMYPPYSGPVSALTSFSYDFYIDAASVGGVAGAQNFYANVYVDEMSNGIGTYAGGFYDCRYDSVPTTGALGGWTTNSFTLSSAWTNVANPLGSCPSTLGDLGAGSLVRWIAINGGQSTSSDAGLKGAYDKVVISTTTDVTTYDFEPVSTCASSTTGTTITLLADCTVASSFMVPNGFTLDGNGYTLTATGTAIKGVVKNAGAVMHVTDLTVTSDGQPNAAGDPEDRLTGVLFVHGGGSVMNTTITNMRPGGVLSGVQTGYGIRVLDEGSSTRHNVTISGNAISTYNKNGIDVRGNVGATITGNTVTGAGPLGVPLAAQNGIVVGFGASAEATFNTASGNNYTPKSYVACGVLWYQATGVRAHDNTLFANERNNCNYGKGGGQYTP